MLSRWWVIIGPGNGLSPFRCQSITWTSADLLSIRTLGTNFNEISIKIQTFPFKKMILKTSPAKWRPFCLGFNVLKCPKSHFWFTHTHTHISEHWCQWSNLARSYVRTVYAKFQLDLSWVTTLTNPKNWRRDGFGPIWTLILVGISMRINETELSCDFCNISQF